LTTTQNTGSFGNIPQRVLFAKHSTKMYTFQLNPLWQPDTSSHQKTV